MRTFKWNGLRTSELVPETSKSALDRSGSPWEPHRDSLTQMLDLACFEKSAHQEAAGDGAHATQRSLLFRVQSLQIKRGPAKITTLIESSLGPAIVYGVT